MFQSDISTQPDMYSPSVDENGRYIDNIPLIKYGLKCPCGSRKDKTYDTQQLFSNHIKSKCHQRWLETINANKANFYVESEKAKVVIQSQQKIIAKMEIELKRKSLIIETLTCQIQELKNKNISID